MTLQTTGLLASEVAKSLINDLFSMVTSMFCKLRSIKVNQIADGNGEADGACDGVGKKGRKQTSSSYSLTGVEDMGLGVDVIQAL